MTSKCLCIETRSAANRLTRLYDDALAPAGITVTQFSLLNTIREADSPTQTALAQLTNLDRSTLARNVKALAAKNLLNIVAGRDARTRKITLSQHGMQALKAGVPLWLDVQSRLENKLGSKRRARRIC